MPAPGGRFTRVYNSHERNAIDPFKSDYLNAATPAARKSIAQVHIFPALFNYWASIGKEINSAEMNAKSEELLKWLRNVWRTKKNPVLKTGRYRLADILWWTRQEEVFREIAVIMGLESADSHTPGWFAHRTKASKNIIDAMTEEERNILEDEAQQIWMNGLPADVQRRLAEDKWIARFTSSAKQNYNEMGLVSISIVAYTGKTGNLNVDIHDDMAKLIEVPAVPFDIMYPDKATEMKRAVLEYLRTLHRAHVGTADNAGANADSKGALEIDPSGFPVAPRPQSWTKFTKGDLEPLYRMYITQHYRLACRDRDRPAPFERIAACQSDFIDPEYVPTGLTIKDPRSMKLDQLVKFFNHIAERESSHGITHAFRFKAVLSSRKKGSLRPARYKEGGADSGEDLAAASKRGPATGPVPVQSIDMSDPALVNEPASLNSLTSQGVRYPDGVRPAISATTGLYTPEDTPAPPVQHDPAEDNAPASDHAGPASLTRRKSKTSALLSLEEGQKYGAKGKRRR